MDPAAAGAPTTHQELAQGLTDLFALLVRMRYISPGHISHPPHRSPPVDAEHLQRLGLDDDAVAAAQAMPQLRHEVVRGWRAEGVELAPGSKALNFLAVAGGQGLPQDDDGREGGFFSGLDGDGGLPGWVLRLTSGAPGGFGVHLLLDARRGTITQYRGATDSGSKDQDWQAMPTSPSGVTLSEMITRIRTLDWVPLVEGGNNQESRKRSLIESPSVRFQTSQHPRPFHEAGPSRADEEAALRQIQQQQQQQDSGGEEDFEAWHFRNEVNHYHALRRIYLDCGWDVGEDGDFDGDRLEQLRGEFARRVKALRGPAVKAAGERRRIEQSARVFAGLPPGLSQVGGLQQMADEDELHRFRVEVMGRYSGFLREAAGDGAL